MLAVAKIQPIFRFVPVVSAVAYFFQYFGNAKPCLYIIHASNVNSCLCFFGYSAQTVLFKLCGFGFPICTRKAQATIYITCVDNVQARFGVAEILREIGNRRHHRDEPKYWLDIGNSQNTGQVLLSTIGNIPQPNSEKYETVATLPFVTEEFGELLKQSEQEDDTPSCSLAEALEKQDLFINSSLTQMGCSLLWNLFRYGMTPYRGFFHNLKNFRTHPMKVA